MAYCAYCGKEISDQAPVCPHCGHPNEALRGGTFPTEAPIAGEYASFGSRFLQLLLDGILIGLVTLPFGGIHRGDNGTVIFYNPARTVIGFAYPWLMIALNKGQTLGMMALNIRITRPNGDPVDLGRSAARSAMAFVSGIALALGYLWALWDPEKRTWHDIVADTRAYKTRT
jgi:uncharacterized RDD family membrane protein YckC